MRLLQEVMEASPDDANQHRHRRELAIAHLLAGDAAEAVRVAASSGRDARHEAQCAGAGGPARGSGETQAARRHVTTLKADTPGLTLETARCRISETSPPREIPNAFEGLRAIGL